MISQEEKLFLFRRRADELLGRRSIWTPGRPRPVGGGAPSVKVSLASLAAAVTKNTFTTAATIIGDGDRGPFDINYFNDPTASWDMDAMGVVSTTATPTLQFLVKTGAALASLTMVAQNTATATLTGLANVDWYLRVLGRTASRAGATSTMLVSGILLGLMYSATVVHTFLKNATPPTAVTTDLTSSLFVDLQAAWGASSASNTITTNYYNLEVGPA